MSVSEIQQALNDAGFGPLVVDGKSGSKTKAAIRAYQKAKGLTVDGIAGPVTQGSLRGGAQATPAASSSGGLPVGATPEQTVQERYPAFSWAFSDPEVNKVLNDAVAGKWGPDEVQGAIHNTNWWKTKTDAERAWLQTLATDPAEAGRRLWNYDSITKYIALSNEYGLPVSFDAAERQIARVVRGEVAPDALEQELRNQAKALYPQLAQQIDAGSTIADVYVPYKQMAAELLGINPTDISLSDPKWQTPLQVAEANGTKRVATTDEWQRLLRTDARYGYAKTRHGSEEGFGIADAIGRAFGNVAS